MRRIFRENGLSIVMFGFFLAFLFAQSVAGHLEHNNDLKEHGESKIGYAAYLGTGHFAESVFENWESEFLQMGSFVQFTVFLRQKGSPGPRSWEVTSLWTQTLGHPSPRARPGRFEGAGWPWPCTSTL